MRSKSIFQYAAFSVLVVILYHSCGRPPNVRWSDLVSTAIQLAIAEEKLPGSSYLLTNDTIYVYLPRLAQPQKHTKRELMVETYLGEDEVLKDALPSHVDKWSLAIIDSTKLVELQKQGLTMEYLTIFRYTYKREPNIAVIKSSVLPEGVYPMDRPRMGFVFHLIRNEWRLKRYHTWLG